MVREELAETEIGRLRAENAGLRARVEALEKALAERSNGNGRAGAPDGAAEAGARSTPLTPTLDWMPTAVPAMIHWRPDGAVTRWNDGAEHLFGWSEGEAVGRRLMDLLSVDPVPTGAARAFAFANEESRFAAATSEVNAKDGRAVACRWTYAVLRDDRGDVREIAAIVDDASDRRRRDQTVYGRYQLLLQLVDNSRSSIFVKDIAGRYVFVNRAYAQSMDKHVIELIGRDDEELMGHVPQLAGLLAAKEREVIAAGRVVQFEEELPSGGEERRHFMTVKFPIHDERGEPSGLGGIVTEITSLRRAEAERAELQEEIIAAQKATLWELSTPLIPLADRVVAMPLVGAIDRGRAEHITETLLAGISGHRAHTAILDITGVRTVDTLVAEALTRTARAAQLLGTRVVLTGVRPEVAQTLVTLGVDLSGITTLSTLQSGIAHALRHAGR